MPCCSERIELLINTPRGSGQSPARLAAERLMPRHASSSRLAAKAANPAPMILQSGVRGTHPQSAPARNGGAPLLFAFGVCRCIT